jgi:UPF0755 protein
MSLDKTLKIITKAFFIVFICSLMWIYKVVQKPNILVGQPSKLLFIPPNTSFSVLQETLYKNGYIIDSTSFRLMARILRYDRKILPGAYRLTSDMGNWRAIHILRAGIQEPVNIILNNIDNKEDLAIKITQNIATDAVTFQNLLDNSAFLQTYGFTSENILTMFIPNTYNVYWTISAEKLFEKMYAEYQKFWKGERLEKAKQLNLTPIEISILASIVQKETNKAEEAPIIAGVYINRLKKGIKLQADPTLLYMLQDSLIKRVLHTHTHIKSPYNTYLYKGLPPGPITVPSITIIDAVLNYQQHDYLYFVTKEDFSGYHYFAKSFEKHKENARKYRKALKEMLSAKKK